MSNDNSNSNQPDEDSDQQPPTDAATVFLEDQTRAALRTKLDYMRRTAELNSPAEHRAYLLGVRAGLDVLVGSIYAAKLFGLSGAQEQLEAERVVLSAIHDYWDLGASQQEVTVPWVSTFPS